MKLRSILLAGFVFIALSLASFAQVGISVNFAPPPLPVVVQPPVPVEGYIWTPGYWAWGGADYYWVPSVWVPPPAVGLLWTPPWWGWNNGVYAFNEGYWAPTVGFYGGINYGYGYFGNGYWGGRWEGDTFRYNTAVTHVNTNIVHNTYVDKSVVNKQVTANRASFNGPNGVKAEATAEQKAAAANAKKMPPTSQQLARQEAASKDHNLQASVNKGHPKPDAIKSFNKTAEHGAGATGVRGTTGAEKTGANAGKISEQAGVGAGAANAGEHGNKHTAENVHGNKQHLQGTQGKGHPGKPPGYAGPAHGEHGMMQGPHHPPMTAYHPQGGGPNRGHPSGQQQGKKKQPGQGGPHGP
jgi:WXXGXW repeat (2 copies)